MNTSFTGKTFLVTGATSGIGLSTAETLAKLGAAVIGVGRSEERCRKSEARLRSLYPQAKITYCTADLSLQSEVRRLAVDIRDRIAPFGEGALDGLVNNAGVFAYWLTLTAEGFEMQWAVNHLAPFLLTHELMPLLKAAPSARIVTVSSASHYNTRLRWSDIQLRRNYNGLLAYKQTKLANVLFTSELNRRLGDEMDIRAYAADPGLVNTEIGLKDSSMISRLIWNMRRKRGCPPQKPAEEIAFLLGLPPLPAARPVYWKDGRPKTPSRFARDEQAACDLWALSERMCAIQSADYGLPPLMKLNPILETTAAPVKKRGWFIKILKPSVKGNCT
jgi:retinol dehydrogenase 12